MLTFLLFRLCDVLSFMHDFAKKYVQVICVNEAMLSRDSYM